MYSVRRLGKVYFAQTASDQQGIMSDHCRERGPGETLFPNDTCTGHTLLLSALLLFLYSGLKSPTGTEILPRLHLISHGCTYVSYSYIHYARLAQYIPRIHISPNTEVIYIYIYYSRLHMFSQGDTMYVYFTPYRIFSHSYFHSSTPYIFLCKYKYSSLYTYRYSLYSYIYFNCATFLFSIAVGGYFSRVYSSTVVNMLSRINVMYMYCTQQNMHPINTVCVFSENYKFSPTAMYSIFRFLVYGGHFIFLYFKSICDEKNRTRKASVQAVCLL